MLGWVGVIFRLCCVGLGLCLGCVGVGLRLGLGYLDWISFNLSGR